MQPAATSFDPPVARRLRALAELASTVVWIASSQGEVRDDNPAWETFTGQTPAQLSGQGWLEAIHPDDRESTRAAWAAAVRQRQVAELRFQLRRHDGSYRHMSAHCTPIAEGDVIQEWVGLATDVTATVHAAKALRRNEERLQFLDRLGQATRAMQDAAEVMAASARLLAEHLGASRCAYADVEADNDRFTIRSDWAAPGLASSAGVYSLDLFGPKATGNLRQGRTLTVRDVRAELSAEGGAEMFLSIGIQAIITAPLVKGDRLVAMMAVHQSEPRDWSSDEIALVEAVVDRCWAHVERVRDAAALRMQDRQKDEFVAQLAHELRNPLAPISYAATFMRLSNDLSQATRMREIIERQVGHMKRLIDDLLDISRVNRGLIELKRVDCTLDLLVGQALEVARPAIDAAGHRLVLDLCPEALSLHADPERMVQVIGNLLSNASKYTPDGGEIRVSTRSENGLAIVQIADDGVGIPPEEQTELFQMFKQLGHTAGRTKGGLGIGLSLARRLVEMHGGRAHVHSAGLGRGSTFTVEVPLATSGTPMGSGTLQHHEGDFGIDALDLDVLVAEDNVDGLEALVSLLRQVGCRVVAAIDGPSALSIARNHRFDVVLLDLGLPHVDGVEVGRQLRQHDAAPRVHLVALTGWGAERDRRRTAEAGFDAHLTKPVEPAVLLRHLVEVARERRLPSL